MNSVQIIVISCSEERKSNMQKQFSELNLPFPVKYLKGSTPENSKDFLPNNTFESYNRKLCCTKSHLRAIIEASNDDSPAYTIIIEDDAAIHTIDFLPTINKLINMWDDNFISPMISIGWIAWEDYAYPCHGPLDKCFNLDSKYKYSYRKVAGTQSYIIKRDWIKQYIKLINQPTFHSLHDIINKTIPNPKNYDIGVADFLLPIIFNPVVVSPPLVIEYSNISMLDQTVDRNDVIWRHIFNNFEHERKLYWSIQNNLDCYIQLDGGLCNQLFQIANGYAYCKRNNLNLLISQNTIGYRGTYWDSFLVNCKKYIGLPTVDKIYFEPSYSYKLIPNDVRHIRGFYQSKKYFSDFENDIKNLFIPSEHILNEVNNKYIDLLSMPSAVVLHIRRGDYISPGLISKHCVTNSNYFINAINEIKKYISSPNIIVFSDDLDWYKKEPYLSDTIFIDEKNDCVALYLMSQFNNYIISNSSFSWWSVYLGKKAEIVIAPSKWFGPKGPQDYQDVYEDNWIKIEV